MSSIPPPSDPEMLSDKMGSTQHSPKAGPTSKSAKFRAFIHEKRNCRNAREACSWAGLPYNRKNACLFYGIRSLRKKKRERMLRGTPSTPYARRPAPLHHVVLGTTLQPEEVAVIQAKVDAFRNPDSRSWSRWYRSSNRNGQLVFTNKCLLATMWPSTGVYQVQIKGNTDEESARLQAKVALVAGGIQEEQARKIAQFMEFASAHFVVTESYPTPPFEYNGLESIGVPRLYSDKSHLCVEGDLKTPTWVEATRVRWENWQLEVEKREDKRDQELSQVLAMIEALRGRSDSNSQAIDHLVGIVGSMLSPNREAGSLNEKLPDLGPKGEPWYQG